MNRAGWGGLRSAPAEWPAAGPPSRQTDGVHIRRLPFVVAEPSGAAVRKRIIADITSTAVAAGAWLLLPAGHAARPGPAVVAVIAYVVGALIRFPAGRGYGAATQPALVLLLFSLPLNVVPAVVLAVKAFVALVRGLRDPGALRLESLGSGWWDVLPPALVLALLAPGDVRASAWLVYALAFGAQFVTDAALSARRNRTARNPVSWAVPIGLGALLTPAGLLVVPEAQQSPAAAAAVLMSLIGVFALVSFEPLTGLANRALFAAMLQAAALRAERAESCGAVLFADLDDFKQINDSRGHAFGDEVLRAVADRFQGNVRRSDLVARVGGDEFAILLGDQGDEPHAEHVAHKLREAFALPLLLSDGQLIRVGVSIGVARFGSAAEAAAVVARADAAMYADKRRAA